MCGMSPYPIMDSHTPNLNNTNAPVHHHHVRAGVQAALPHPSSTRRAEGGDEDGIVGEGRGRVEVRDWCWCWCSCW